MNVPYLNRYRNAEFLQYFKGVLQLLTELNAKALKLDLKQKELQPIVDRIDVAFKRRQRSTITQEIVYFDEQRDNALTGLRYVILGYKSHYTEAIADAATALFESIDKYGSTIQKMNYQEETAVLDSIIKDWEAEPELSKAIGTLNLTDWVAYLKETNINFFDRYLARVEEEVANPVESLLAFRTEATVIYRELIAQIDAHITLDTEGAYTKLKELISVLAGQYNQMIDNRSENNTSSNELADDAINTTDEQKGEE